MVRWSGTQASSDNAQGVIQNTVNERVCALRHQTGAKYSRVEKTKDRATVRSVLAPAHHSEPQVASAA